MDPSPWQLPPWLAARASSGAWLGLWILIGGCQATAHEVADAGAPMDAAAAAASDAGASEVEEPIARCLLGSLADYCDARRDRCRDSASEWYARLETRAQSARCGSLVAASCTSEAGESFLTLQLWNYPYGGTVHYFDADDGSLVSVKRYADAPAFCGLSSKDAWYGRELGPCEPPDEAYANVIDCLVCGPNWDDQSCIDALPLSR